MPYFDSMHDRLFNCAIVYRTPGGARKQMNAKTIAPAADLALEIAVKLLHADKRRQVADIEHYSAIEQ